MELYFQSATKRNMDKIAMKAVDIVWARQLATELMEHARRARLVILHLFVKMVCVFGEGYQM